MIISVINQKGGVGKTTLAIHLAVVLPLIFPEGVRTLLVDADTQGTARDWNVRAIPFGSRLDFMTLDRPSIDQDVLPHSKRYDFTIIDAPSGIDPLRKHTSTSIIRCSAVLLIPTKTGKAELDALKPLYDLISDPLNLATQKPKSATVICQQNRRTICARQMKQDLKDAGLHVFDAGTENRISYITSIGCGQTVLETSDQAAKDEIFAIANELKEFLS